MSGVGCQNIHKSIRQAAVAGGAAGETLENGGIAATAPKTACSETATKAGVTVWLPVGGTAATGKTAHEAATRGQGAHGRSRR